MTFAGCKFCGGTGWVPVYSKKIIDAIRRDETWKYHRSAAMCSCHDGQRYAGKFQIGTKTAAAFQPDQFCRDESAGWDWAGADERRERHVAAVRAWLAARGTELIGTFSMDEWGANHGG